jgi:hypothetical protein
MASTGHHFVTADAMRLKTMMSDIPAKFYETYRLVQK